jgi:glucose-6-phosphate 1-dehydrogenase
VQNILVFRFANGIFEPIWNNKYIDHIQISVSESVGVEGRSAYFDENGIVRDIAQNHLLQLLSLLCIEPPNSLSYADAIRDEKVKVLRALVPLATAASSFDDVAVRGQYGAGVIAGNSLAGYLTEEGVASQSSTETFAALRVEVDNWRWSGVPIFLRVGKRLPKRITEIVIQFKSPPGSLFKGRLVSDLKPNVLAIQIQPNESISLTVLSKPPGPRMRAKPVRMDFSYDNSFGVDSPEAYERLLLDAMRGDATLFIRNDEIEIAWSFLDPLLTHWKNQGTKGLCSYPSGSWGPAEAFELIERTGRKWRSL